MNIFLVIIICTTLGAMVFWAMHIDRCRSDRKRSKEAETVASVGGKWAAQDRDFEDPQEP